MLTCYERFCPSDCSERTCSLSFLVSLRVEGPGAHLCGLLWPPLAFFGPMRMGTTITNERVFCRSVVQTLL